MGTFSLISFLLNKRIQGTLQVFSFFSLQVVSTRVGGVPEVLPSDMIKLAEPSVTGKLKMQIQHFVVVVFVLINGVSF